MKKLRVMQIGTGRFTHSGHTMMGMKAMPDVYEIVGVCEPDPQAKALAMRQEAYRGVQWFELEDVWKDTSLDAIIVETNEADQAKMALLCVEHGFPVHMDKPGGEDVETFEKLVEAVKRKGVAFQVGYMLRFNPAVVKLMEAIQNGELGEILYVEAQMSPDRYGRDFTRDIMGYMRGGMAYYLSCHLMDLVYRLQGAPKEIIPMNMCTGIRGTEGMDFGFVAYRYPHGISFVKTTAMEIGGSPRRQLVVCGTKGSAEIKPLEIPVVVPGLFSADEVNLHLSIAEDEANKYRAEDYHFEAFGRYTDMMLDFAKIVRGEKENAYTPDYELEVFKFIQKSM